MKHCGPLKLKVKFKEANEIQKFAWLLQGLLALLLNEKSF